MEFGERIQEGLDRHGGLSPQPAGLPLPGRERPPCRSDQSRSPKQGENKPIAAQGALVGSGREPEHRTSPRPPSPRLRGVARRAKTGRRVWFGNVGGSPSAEVVGKHLGQACGAWQNRKSTIKNLKFGCGPRPRLSPTPLASRPDRRAGCGRARRRHRRCAGAGDGCPVRRRGRS